MLKLSSVKWHNSNIDANNSSTSKNEQSPSFAKICHMTFTTTQYVKIYKRYLQYVLSHAMNAFAYGTLKQNYTHSFKMGSRTDIETVLL